jgi:glycosyltransferase involved in cell wall biosynthesis
LGWQIEDMITRNGGPAEYEADLLLVLPVCLGQDARGLLLESQAANGIERWLENFSRIQVLCPVFAADELRAAHSTVWKPVSEIANADRVKFVPLPFVNSYRAHARVSAQVRSITRQAIHESRYLSFALGGQLFGDWGAAACLAAQQLGRPYSVWTDAVQHKLCLTSGAGGNPLRWLKTRVRSRMMYSVERRCITGSSLGLFHGASCYAEYAPWCPTSYVVHDVHAKQSDAISNEQLATKCGQIATANHLQIIYAGRADAIKGPFDWIAAMSQLRDRGVAFRATWLGDGPLLGEMKSEIARRGLSDVVSLPGFVSNRDELLAQLRAAHVLVFCHTTPESPRNLVEALISGCPIVGYHSDFAEELVADGGGAFVKMSDIDALVDRLASLNSNRQDLIAMTQCAAKSGKRFNDVAVFRHRSDLIKKHL